jgi:hypothetical protein
MSSASQKRWNHHAARETVGFSSATAVTRFVRVPRESWWARPECQQARDAFDQAADRRALEAGWRGENVPRGTSQSSQSSQKSQR